MDAVSVRRTDQRLVLEALGAVLGKEAHNLTRWPELLWQQLYNRLQWGAADGLVAGVLGPELAKRSRPGAAVWLHVVTRLRESEALLATLPGAGPVHAVAFTPDGSRVVTGSRQEALTVWDAAGGIELLSATSPERSAEPSHGIRAFDPGEYRADLVSGDVWALACSPDGTRIATGSYASSMVSGKVDGALRIRDASTGTELARLTGPGEGPVRAVDFSPDGGRVVAGCGDRVRMWDVTRGTELPGLAGSAGTAWAVRFSPDGSRIAVGSNDWGPGGTVTVWDATTGAQVAGLTPGERGLLRAVAWSPDSRRVAAACGDVVRVWDAVGGAELLVLAGHAATVWTVDFSPDGTRIVSGAEDRTVKIWDAASGAELASLTGHDGRVRAVGRSPDGSRIVSGSDQDGTLRIWDAAAATDRPARSGHAAAVDAVAFSPDGGRIVSGSDDGTLKVWDAIDGAELATLTGHSDEVWAVAWSPEGAHLVSGSQDGTVRVWDAARGTEMVTLSGHQQGVTGVAWAPDGTRIVSSCLDGTLTIWDARTGAELATLTEPGQVQVCAVAWSPDGTRIVADASRRTSGSGDPPCLRIWDAGTGRLLATFRHRTTRDVWAVTWSPDGTRILSGGAGNAFGEDGLLVIWDAATGATVASVAGHDKPVRAVTYTPDQAYVISSALDGTVRVWDAGTLACVAVLPLGTVVHCCRHSPTGHRVCCGDSNGTVHILELVVSS